MTKDVGYSWVIALACCFINCLLFGVTRLSGQLMISTVETFQVTRARAALPFSVCTSVRNLSGVYAGYLSQKLGLRTVISTGCILASFGAGFCFFASDVFWITICWGGLFGIGCGFATCLLPLAINNYFEKHRGIAIGLSYSGSYIGSFIFPSIVAQLIKLYGLQGAFLVISAALLNGLAASFLFRTTSSKAIENKRVLNSENIIKQVRDKASEQPVHRVSDGCLNLLFLKKIHHIKMCLFYSKELADDTRFEIPVLLTSSVCLQDQNDISAYKPFSRNSLHYKRSVRNNTGSTLLNSTYLKARNFNSKNHPEEFYLHCKNSISKGNSNSDYKNKVTKLKRITLARLFMKHYNLRNIQHTSLPDVQLVSIKTAGEIFYTINITNSLFETNCHDIDTSNKEVCEAIAKEPSSNSKRNQAKIENTFDSNENPQKESSNEDLVLKTTRDVLNSTHLYPKVTENESSIEGMCSQSISRLEQAKVSFSQSGKSPETKNSEDSTSSQDNASPCTSNDTDSQENSKYLSGSKSISKSLQESGIVRNTAKCCFGWFQMYADPMFIVITTTMSLHSFVVVCMITIIEDYAKDVNVPENKVYTVLMALSVADLLGALTLGVVTDRKLMSGCSFVALCFLAASACIVAISLCRTLSSLLVMVSCYGLFETGVIITLPMLITQFVKEKRQAVALAASNILSSPTVLLVPLVIGYFRDRGGCYSGVFYVLAITSLTSGLVWMVAPYLIQKYRSNKASKCKC